MQEASRAGQKAKEAYIEQLIERKRETFFTELNHQLNQFLSYCQMWCMEDHAVAC
jgi:hypothetical protein